MGIRPIPRRRPFDGMSAQACADLASAMRNGKEVNEKGESMVTRPVMVETPTDFLDLFSDYIHCNCIGSVVPRDEAVRCGCDNKAQEFSRS